MAIADFTKLIMMVMTAIWGIQCSTCKPGLITVAFVFVVSASSAPNLKPIHMCFLFCVVNLSFTFSLVNFDVLFSVSVLIVITVHNCPFQCTDNKGYTSVHTTAGFQTAVIYRYDSGVEYNILTACSATKCLMSCLIMSVVCWRCKLCCAEAKASVPGASSWVSEWVSDWVGHWLSTHFFSKG